MSNFEFLQAEWPELSVLGALAERYLHQDANVTLIKLRLFAETQTKYLIAYENLNEPYDGTQMNRLNVLQSRGVIPETLVPLFHSIRMAGNRATHEGYASDAVARTQLQVAHHLAGWFAKTYSASPVAVHAFSMPVPVESQEELKTLASELIRANERLEEENVKLQEKLEVLKIQEVSNAQRAERRKSSARASNKISLTEAETRQIIDDQLSTAGWMVDTVNLRYANGARPEKGIYKAIAEWPTASGPADYALFVGMELIGLVEAKKWGKQVVSDVSQAKRYACDVTIKGEAAFSGGPWNQYKVPFMFATNGRPYLKQLEQQSGIWLLDGRDPTNHPRPLHAWYSPEGLIDLLKQDIVSANKKLKAESFDYLSLRDYQVTAVRKVEEALLNKQQNILLAMATGTGKTRTAIGLIYRLIKSDRFKRVLFLVDRNALGEQASDSFHDIQIEDFLSFSETYGVKDINHPEVESETRVDVSTVQSIMRRILFSLDDTKIPPVDVYDCIVVDEAHRGYTLDREMDESELVYRDQKDYISKYRKVIEYFDAVKIGMTATPAPHTAEIFGKPVFTYSYREAVIDGWLVDHEPPHQIITSLSESGIKWKKGDTLPVLDTQTGEITNIEDIPDEVAIDLDGFNRKVITESFNRVVIQELVKHLDPNGDEKTLVFAASDDHADTIVRILKEEFEAMGCPTDDDAIQKITGSIDKPLQAIRHYKNEKFPNIAVTVDLLTTGIDVHKICNLVFIRRVRSRILYEQMLGRATRLCDEIKKDHFNVYDAVRLYEALEEVSNMKPVSPNPKTTLVMLIDELLDSDDPEKQKRYTDQLVAKLQRKARGITKETSDQFETLTGGVPLSEFIKNLRHAEPEQTLNIVQTHRNYFEFLDENNRQPRRVLVSSHRDELLSHTRGYGSAKKPEDYLNEFKEFILDNMNTIEPLRTICQKPSTLTRQSLKEVRLALDREGFSAKNLRVAWKEANNEDIDADVISFIRRLALGFPLRSHEDRIQTAMRKIRSSENWTAIQSNWLDRFEMQLMKESIIQKEDLNEGVFREEGGFDRINKVFQGRLTAIIDQLNEALYTDQRKYG